MLRLGRENQDGEYMNLDLSVCQGIQVFQELQTALYPNIMPIEDSAVLQYNKARTKVVFIILLLTNYLIEI